MCGIPLGHHRGSPGGFGAVPFFAVSVPHSRRVSGHAGCGRGDSDVATNKLSKCRDGGDRDHGLVQSSGGDPSIRQVTYKIQSCNPYILVCVGCLSCDTKGVVWSRHMEPLLHDLHSIVDHTKVSFPDASNRLSLFLSSQKIQGIGA